MIHILMHIKYHYARHFYAFASASLVCFSGSRQPQAYRLAKDRLEESHSYLVSNGSRLK